MPLSVTIIVPRLDDSGPVKGAVALANGLKHSHDISFVALKGCAGSIKLDGAIRFFDLKNHGGLINKLRVLRRILQEIKAETIISYCFSADLMTFLLPGTVRKISSVRGNLLKNYRYTYGVLGILLALVHYCLLKSFSSVIVMSQSMAAQLACLGQRLILIHNFVDEPALSAARIKPTDWSDPRPQFLFLGGLTRRKRPELLIELAKKLRAEGLVVNIKLAGEGPLRAELSAQIKQAGLQDHVEILGHIALPYGLIQQADYLVLPSESEGVPRSALEALYYGVPVIARDVDSNAELIEPLRNGFLFKHDDELTGLMKKIIEGYQGRQTRQNLLPDEFRFSQNIEKFNKLLVK